MRNKRADDDQENTDRWVVSYADFITLLFAFFTTMYAISRVDAGKLDMFSGSMRTALKSGSASAPKQVIEGIVPIPAEISALRTKITKALEKSGNYEGITVTTDERGVVISFVDGVLFDPGRAEIREQATGALAAAASVLSGITNRVAVEGHTDNLPLTGKTGPYKTNWELSSARASSVLSRLLSSFNLAPARFSAAGFAEFRPAASNATPEGRAKNRRVDLVVFASDATQDKN